ncbi:hypothetical protein PENSOL_c021G01795 [Penicillium solitum]|uniref:NADP-dependent oxidoreductase domain-containing protein n=1 Tax=Penicillium solitum TaxID=60172 RepID=A0A1V6R1C5_9EURO|nr:uncharacterized protein PENSOL_c021G01795 [Penicillium solitum]OQD95254.1 hypothetical protein PENSOL_c021G01795 [Penicillium solitum]
MGSMNKGSAFRLLDAFYEAGGNFIDTANIYQNEQSEEWIGEWAEASQNRDSLVLATKFTMDYRSHAIGKGPRAANFPGNSRHSIHVSVRDSLKKLRTDYIDIDYVHYWDFTTSIKEVMDALHILVEQASTKDVGTFITATPSVISFIPIAREFGMALAPWDVLGGGKFQSKAELERRKTAGEGLRAFAGRPPHQTEEEIKVSEALEKVASEHGIESVTSVALAYVMSKAGNVFPLIGGRKVEHLKDNIQALSLKLTQEQIEHLESVRPFNPGFPHNFIPADPNVTGSSFLIGRTNAMKFPNAQKPTSL